MRSWEYRTTTDPADLEALGREGWELVSVTQRGTELVHYLRRPLPTLAERVTLEQRDQVKRSPTPDYRAASGPVQRGILNPDLLALVAREGAGFDVLAGALEVLSLSGQALGHRAIALRHRFSSKHGYALSCACRGVAERVPWEPSGPGSLSSAISSAR